MHSATLPTLRVISLLPTAALLSLDILLTTAGRRDSTRWSASVASAVLGSVDLTASLALLAVNSSGLLDRLTTGALRAVIASMGLLCLSNAGASVVVAHSVSRVSVEEKSTIVDGIANDSLVIIYAVILGVSVLSQLGFVATFLSKLQKHSTPSVESGSTDADSAPSLRAAWRVKAVPYSSTRPSMADARGITSFDSTGMMPMQRCTSPTPTYDSTHSSFSHTMNRTSSKRRLLSLRELQQPAMLDGELVRESSDAYADPLADDPPPRWFQTLEAPSLETIPASPVVGESDFGRLSDLNPPPPVRQRSRSYSPMGARLPPPILDPEPRRDSADELHIHPLFRSDSPTPPPMATPGTTVTASPDAGKVIHHAPSNQSLRRLRSGSLLAQPSPLSRSSSTETFGAFKGRDPAHGRARAQSEVRRGGSSSSSIESARHTGTPPTPTPAGWVRRASDESSEGAAAQRQ